MPMSGSTSRRFNRTALHVENLESRQLLSATAQLPTIHHVHQARHAHNAVLARSHVSLNITAKPAATPDAVMSSGPYTPSQIRSAYSLTGNFRDSNGNAIVGDGSGQTIGIVDAYFDSNIQNDLRAFDAQFGLPNTDAYGQSVLTQVRYGSTANAGWGLETDLDVEWAHAIAPKAHILLVEAANSSTANLLTAVDYARTHGAGIVSMSWGSNEFNG